MGFGMGGPSGVLCASAASGEANHRERVFAAARFMVAICCLFVAWLSTTAPGRYSLALHVLLPLYIVHSLIILILARFHPKSGLATGLSVHIADVLWPALITLFTGGPSSPFFVLFVFALLAATSRWSVWEVLGTALASVLLFLSEAAFVASHVGPWFGAQYGRLRTDVVITQVMSLLIMGVFLGYLAERERRSQREDLAVRRISQLADPDKGTNETLGGVLRIILRVFGADRALLVLKRLPDGRAFEWELGSAGIESSVLRCAELGVSERDRRLFPIPGKSWFLRRSSGTLHYRFLALDNEGRRLEKCPCSLPENLFSNQPFRTLLAADFRLREEWMGRVYLFEIRNSKHLERELRFFQKLIGEVAPAVHRAYLVRRIGHDVRSSERARISRDLHDGVIQSLIALEMRVDTLRRQAAGVSSGAVENLEIVRNLLRQEVINLRDLMQQLKSEEVTPRQLLTWVADRVDSFQHDTGIKASFLSDAQIPVMHPHVSREVARIVQEALTNVRKHSGARSVQVHLRSEQGLWKLVIKDDGQGFEFSGRLSLSELDLARQGPRVIKERVHSIEGELAIDSHPSQGARLEVSFASKAYGESG